jgi:folate-binding protein YgfZ
MADRHYALNEERACLVLGGEDAASFLQGMLSNDVTKVGRGRAIYAAFLTAQGRLLHDLFVAQPPAGPDAGSFILDGEAARLDDLKRRLTMYKLRAKVTIADARDRLAVALLWGASALAALDLPAEPGRARPWQGGVVFVDPRLAALGARAILPSAGADASLAAAGFAAAPLRDHQRLRLSLGVPEGSRDMPAEKALLLESGFEELNGVDFEKGCYIGQELTARMKHRGLVKKRLFPVAIEGPLPAPGTPVMLGAEEVGEMRAGLDGVGLALLKAEPAAAAAATGKPLTAGDALLRPKKPAWFAA